MSRSDEYYKACIILPYPEVHDDRDESSVPELELLVAKLDVGRRLEAIEYGLGLTRHYPDNDLVPTIVGTLLTQQGRPHQVEGIVRDALPNCPRRYRLYAMAGQAALAQNQLANAAVWWSRSAVAQCQVVDYQVYTPFYNLAHAALVLDAYHEAETFLAMSSAIDSRAPHLSQDLEALLEPLRSHWVAGPLLRVLQHIEVNYLHSKS
jgi:hypothetical protein